MKDGWKTVPLGEVLELANDAVPTDPASTYVISGVYSFGKGLFGRGPLAGTETTYKCFHRLHEDTLVISQLKAWEGAIARVTAEFDGWFLSPQFQTFRPISDRLDIRFLEWYCKRSSLWTLLAKGSRGMGARRDSVSPKQFLKTPIPLPPLSEQWRIVAKVEELAAKIDEARTLQQKIGDECDALCRSIVMADPQTALTPMDELVSLRNEDVTVLPTETYHFAGIYCFGRGVFVGDQKTGLDFAYKSLTRLKTGDFVYPKLMAWEGALGIVPAECDGLCVSPEYPVFTVNTKRVLPETLDVYYRTPSVWPKLAEISTGTNVRRRRLNPKSFLAYQMPLPSMETQLKLRAVKSHLSSLKSSQSQSAAELDALLPSILDKAFKGEL